MLVPLRQAKQIKHVNLLTLQIRATRKNGAAIPRGMEVPLHTEAEPPFLESQAASGLSRAAAGGVSSLSKPPFLESHRPFRASRRVAKMPEKGPKARPKSNIKRSKVLWVPLVPLSRPGLARVPARAPTMGGGVGDFSFN